MISIKLILKRHVPSRTGTHSHLSTGGSCGAGGLQRGSRRLPGTGRSALAATALTPPPLPAPPACLSPPACPAHPLRACRLQRRDCGLQEHQLYGVGRGRPGQDPSPVAALLPKHAGHHLRGGQQRQGTCGGWCVLARRADAVALAPLHCCFLWRCMEGARRLSGRRFRCPNLLSACILTLFCRHCPAPSPPLLQPRRSCTACWASLS